MSYGFTCTKCGSSDLDYQRLARVTEPVIIHPDERVEYGPTTIDNTEEFEADRFFVCRECGKRLQIWNRPATKEADLIEYLRMTPEQRTKMLHNDLDYLVEQMEAELYLQKAKTRMTGNDW